MDRSLDEIAAEMHSAQADDSFSSQAYEERAFVGAEDSLGHGRSSASSRRYAPYPSVDREDSGSRLFSRKSAQAGSSSSDSTKRLFVANISFSISWQRLKEHMRRGTLVVHNNTVNWGISCSKYFV